MSEITFQPKPGSPIGAEMPDHPWVGRTGRRYYEDRGGDRFKIGNKILTQGEVFIKYSGHLPDPETGAPGAHCAWWEHVPEPKSRERLIHLD